MSPNEEPQSNSTCRLRATRARPSPRGCFCCRKTRESDKVIGQENLTMYLRLGLTTYLRLGQAEQHHEMTGAVRIRFDRLRQDLRQDHRLRQDKRQDLAMCDCRPKHLCRGEHVGRGIGIILVKPERRQAWVICNLEGDDRHSLVPEGARRKRQEPELSADTEHLRAGSDSVIASRICGFPCVGKGS